MLSQWRNRWWFLLWILGVHSFESLPTDRSTAPCKARWVFQGLVHAYDEVPSMHIYNLQKNVSLSPLTYNLKIVYWLVNTICIINVYSDTHLICMHYQLKLFYIIVKKSFTHPIQIEIDMWFSLDESFK